MKEIDKKRENWKHDIDRLQDAVVDENQARVKAEAEIQQFIGLNELKNQRIKDLEAQRDALVRLIKNIPIAHKDPYGHGGSDRPHGHNRLRETLQTGLKKILGPDWEDPLEELYKLIMEYTPWKGSQTKEIQARAKEIMAEGKACKGEVSDG